MNKYSATSVKIESASKLKEEQVDAFIKEVVEVEESAWPEELRASKAKFLSRFKIFSEGFLVAKIESKIKGVSTSQITNYPSSSKTWDETTDKGFIDKSHDPRGNALYIVSIGVAKDAQGMGIGSILLNAQKDISKQLGLKYAFLGARMPGYDVYCREYGELAPEEYLKIKNHKGETFDPEIRFYERNGLKVGKIVQDFEPDVASRDFGVIMLWGR